MGSNAEVLRTRRMLTPKHATLGCGRLTLIDVRGIGLLARLGSLLLVARGSSLLAGLLLLSGSFGSGGLGGGFLLGGGFGRHFG